MNRYVITQEEIGGQNYLISALFDEKKRMLEVLPESLSKTSILGNIYIGRVENVVENLNAAFIKIAPDLRCYLSLEDVRRPIFTKKLSEKKALVAGEELLVQVCREAIKTKEAAVTTNLSFSGTYGVLTTGNRQVGISKKLTKEKRKHYQELLQENGGQWKDWGIVIRTNASEVSDEVLLKELWELSEKGSIVLKTACHKTCYSLLYAETSAWSKQMRSLRRKELEEIVTDNREIYEEICAYYQIPPNHLITGAGIPTPVDQIKTAEGICLRYHRDAALSLSALYGIKAKLEDALKVRVWLKSGAYLMIEHTEALTVIDVNTGKNVEKKRMQENFLKINLEAAAEIARQLRLRNLSGIILVDFMNLTDPDANQRLLTSLREAVKADPVPTQIIDMTRLGLVEITRKKEKKSLRELLGYGT